MNFGDRISKKNTLWDKNVKNISPDSESAPPRHNVCQFSGKNEELWFFHPKLAQKWI